MMHPDANPPVPSLEEMLGAIMVDDPDAPPAASYAGCDAAGAWAVVLARLRRGPMSIRERMATLMVIHHLGVAGREDDLAAVALDDGLDATARSCVLTELTSIPTGLARLAAIEKTLGPAAWNDLLDTKLTLEFALQMPDPNMADGLAKMVASAPPVLRAELFARFERCRRAAGMPALLAWWRALSVSSLAALHDRMVAAVADEGDAGTSAVAEVFWTAMKDEGTRARFAEVMARITSRALRAPMREAEGVAWRLGGEDGAQWVSFVAHPGRLTFVAQGRETADGDVEVGEVVMVPYEASLQAQGDPASARQVTLGELRDRVVARTRRALSGGGKVDFAACVLLCLLDGVPTPAPPRDEPRRGTSN